MKLTVVIPCLDGARTIGAQLGAIEKQQWWEPWEVIVADNGSTDGTPSVVRRYQGRVPGLRLVDASDRRGQPHALNVGVREATGDVLAFIDADDEVGRGWLCAIGEALRRHRFVACRMDLTKLNPLWAQGLRQYSQAEGLRKTSYFPYLLHASTGTLGTVTK